MADVHSLLRRPLYAFDLPKDIWSTLQIKGGDGHAEQGSEANHETESPTAVAEEAASSRPTSCTLCGVTFKDFQGQRIHAKSDFHRYNLKQKLRGLPSVNETEFDTLVDNLDESISGSETSDSDEDAEHGASKSKDDILAALLKKQAKISMPANSSDGITLKRSNRVTGKSPMYWFASPKLPSNVSLGIYRAIFTSEEQEQESHILDAIRKRQLSPSVTSSVNADNRSANTPTTASASPHYFLCMIGGGHFAAMVVSLVPKIGKNSTGTEERKANVLAHKTFHRYTTRRKQGGAQSSNDAAKGAAHSAGSSLRRYNEAALTNEVRELLNEWRPMIDSAELLFVRATGNTNRRTLYGPYEKQVLHSNDPRIRGFPFSTRRATQAELMRAFVELTRVKVSEVDEAALAASVETTEAGRTGRSATSAQLGGKPAIAPASKISDEEAAALLHTSQLQSLIRRSKAAAVISYILNNSLSADFLFHPTNTKQHHHASTPLHLAASTNSPTVVHGLLTRANANPTFLNGEGKPAFALAGDRATRDAFRVARHELGEDRWDWAAALVPPGLSKAETDRRDARERQEAEAQESQRRQTELERINQLEAAATKVDTRKTRAGNALGTTAKSGAEQREEEARGLTPEMRMRLERERRARAAEERIRKMQQGGGGPGPGIG